MVEMIKVESSDLYSIGYENNTLYILFNSGGLYKYMNVDFVVYKELLNATSKGKFFHQYIKNNYNYQKIN